MLAQYLDLTEEINANGYCIFETSNYDYAIVQIINPSTTTSFFATLDSGAIQGVSDGNATSSINYISIVGKDLLDGSTISSLGVAGLVKFDVVGRYIKLQGSSGSYAKLLVMLTKIS